MEKRRCQRLSLELPATIQAIGPTAGLSKATTIDVSALGIRILIDEQLTVGQEVDLVLLIDGEKINLKVKVAWVEKAVAAAAGKYFAGVKILETPDRDELKFVKFFAKKLIECSKK